MVFVLSCISFHRTNTIRKSISIYLSIYLSISGTCEEPGGQVPGGVDGVAAVEAEADSDPEHGEPHVQGDQLLAHLQVQIYQYIYLSILISIYLFIHLSILKFQSFFYFDEICKMKGRKTCVFLQYLKNCQNQGFGP